MAPLADAALLGARWGSPARAGMARPPASRNRGAVGFPRPRGDGAALAAYSEARVELGEQAITLNPSRPPIARIA
jgi:hypothetical protein